MENVTPFDFDSECNRPDWFAVVSIKLGELYEDGWFDLFDESWKFPQYSDEQHKRLCDKILDHYYYREIAIIPPGEWKREFLRKMREIMPKYMMMYKYLDEYPELLGATSEYYKSRNIYSDFPQTQLNGTNGDYASSGNDMEFERLRQMDILDLAERLRSYDDVDVLIIEEIEPLFSCLFTVNVNAY